MITAVPVPVSFLERVFGINFGKSSIYETVGTDIEEDNEQDIKTVFAFLCPDLVKKYGPHLREVPYEELAASLTKNELIFESQKEMLNRFSRSKKFLHYDGVVNLFPFFDENRKIKVFVVVASIDGLENEARFLKKDYTINIDDCPRIFTKK